MAPRQDRAIEFDDNQLGPVTEACEQALQRLARGTSALLTVHLHGDGSLIQLWVKGLWGVRGAQGWFSSW
jgi:hypothetical protein